MRRLQLIEFHEQAWFPSSLRDEITEALQFGFRILNAYSPIVPLLESALDATGSRSIVDLCSGAGGPWVDLARKLKSRTQPSGSEQALPDLQIWLTDKYPNLGAFHSLRAASANHINFYPDAVDAMRVPGELKGMRTIFTSFHHFPPEEARAILQNAVDAGEAIAIFETPRRAPSTISLVFAFVLMLFVCTPWIRPFRWSRLLWTYMVPILPLVLLFDGIVSCLRTYRPCELREMIGKLSGREYRWKIGEDSTGEIPITYMVGYPQASSSDLSR